MEAAILNIHVLHTAPSISSPQGGSVLMLALHHSVVDNGSIMALLDAWGHAADSGELRAGPLPVFGRCGSVQHVQSCISYGGIAQPVIVVMSVWRAEM